MSSLRAVVTGGATNIGRAISEALIAQGGRVVVGQPDVSVAKPLLEKYGDRVRALTVDVGDPAQCTRFIDEAAAVWGGLDVLVNNAALVGAPAMASLEALDAASFQRLVGVNLGGVLFCSQAAARHMRAQKRGVIIHISSINAIRPQRGAMLYAAAKAAVSSLAQSMGKELAADGIRVVAVAPGDIRVDTSESLILEMSRRGVVSDVANQTPLGPGVPSDVAQVVAFLCSDQARFVTGTTWLVDGGLLA
ncbi:MAG TPA: SDR family NAD(P)-dependent oxidoreductase [Opitutaceae bacterium]|nr:SDR family NAD(P)-dependent oxidoreductase [Opitutaceae bacterium]